MWSGQWSIDNTHWEWISNALNNCLTILSILMWFYKYLCNIYTYPNATAIWLAAELEMNYFEAP